MALARITKDLLDKVKAPAKGHAVTWDTSPGLGGFGIRVSPTGRISFLVRYWNGKRERWQTLGAYPELNLTDARDKAKALLLRTVGGGDPIAEDEAAEAEAEAAETRKAADTVAAFAAEWLEALPNKTTRRGRRISPRTVEQYEGCMRLYVLPLLGSKPVLDVTRRDVAALLATATKKGGPYTGNRAVSVLSIFFAHLESIEAVPAGFNPAKRPPRNPETKRGEHVSVRLKPEQEARLLAAIYGRMKADPIGATAVLTLLDTGRRKQEVLRLEWRRLDLDAGTADLGSTKGKKAGDVCWLSPRVRAAIRQLPRIVGNPYVFTGSGKTGRRSGLQSTWEAIREAAGLMEISPELEGFHLHDLRHHRISEMLAAGVAPQLVARQVGHTSLEQLRTYSHLEVADVAAVLSRLDVVEPAAGGEVVRIGGRR